jgi:ubiquinone biosynthesis protein UbiJ
MHAHATLYAAFHVSANRRAVTLFAADMQHATHSMQHATHSMQHAAHSMQQCSANHIVVRRRTAAPIRAAVTLFAADMASTRRRSPPMNTVVS